jgi:hypothetical protein
MSTLSKYGRKVNKWLNKQLGSGGLADIRIGDIGELLHDIVGVILNAEAQVSVTKEDAISLLKKMIKDRLGLDL